MADNKQAGAAVGSGPTFATDEIAGIDYPRSKLVWGVDGVATDASASNPLPVVQTGTPALPTGAATETTLAAASAKLPATLGQKVMSASMSMVIASDQGAIAINDNGGSITVDASSLPLPSGASTAAKQPALGTAGTPSADVITVQGTASMTAIKTDGSAVTQPVSASSLPLPTGAATETTLAAVSAKLPSALGQTTMAGSMSVAIASNQGNIGINDGGTSLTIDSPQLPSALGQATMANSLPVVLASNQTSLPATVTNAGTFAVQDSEKVTDNAAFTDGATKVLPAGFIFDEVAGTALTENDTAAARVDSKRAIVFALEDATTRGQRQAVNAGGAAEVQGDVAHDAAISGNPVRMAGRAGNADYTAVANGDTADILTDLNGKQIVMPYAVPENFISGVISTAMTGTTSTSLVAAPGAGLRNYITTLIVSNSHATVGTDIIIQDGSGGTTLMVIPASAVYGGAVITLPTPLRQPTANTALFCANVTTGSSTKVSAIGYKAP